MFGMIPFERNDDNFFDLFDNFERKFFGNSSAALPDFRTDIRDAGDRFVLEAELPGFSKEDIKLDVKDGILTISAEHKEHSEPGIYGTDAALQTTAFRICKASRCLPTACACPQMAALWFLSWTRRGSCCPCNS